MGVPKERYLDFDPVMIQRIAEQVQRVSKRRTVSRQKLTVSTGGTRFDHRLGRIPDVIIMPLAEMTVWQYIPPDAKSVYLKSDTDGEVLVSLK